MPSVNYQQHTVQELKNLCDERRISSAFFQYKNRKNEYVVALVRADELRSLKPRQQRKKAIEVFSPTISAGSAETAKVLSDLPPPGGLHQASGAYKITPYLDWTIEQLAAQLKYRDIYSKNYRDDHRMALVLTFDDTKHILGTLPFEQWPQKYLDEMAKEWGVLEDTREKTVAAMNIFERDFEYPDGWDTAVFLFVQKAPVDYLAGLCEAINKLFVRPTRGVLLECLAEYEKEQECLNGFKHTVEEIYGISFKGRDPYRVLHPHKHSSEQERPKKKPRLGSPKPGTSDVDQEL
jgi:hypothetical protein